LPKLNKKVAARKTNVAPERQIASQKQKILKEAARY
jgi:hypothetical protein